VQSDEQGEGQARQVFNVTEVEPKFAGAGQAGQRSKLVPQGGDRGLVEELAVEEGDHEDVVESGHFQVIPTRVRRHQGADPCDCRVVLSAAQAADSARLSVNGIWSSSFGRGRQGRSPYLLAAGEPLTAARAGIRSA
jgi:hypothetical protein